MAQRLILRCDLSGARLTDPAKGQGCGHAAQCNYAVLCDHINLTQACPVCSGQVRREREVVRDEALCVGLAQLPAEAEAAWLRSDGGGRWLRPEAVDGGCKSEGLPTAHCKSEGQWAEIEIGPAPTGEGQLRKRKPAGLEHEARNLAHLFAPGWKDATAGPVNARRVRKKPGAPEYIGCFCTTHRHLKSNDLPFEGLWIQCEECTRWCHAECIGRTAQELLENADYYCPTCRPCAPCCTCAACAPPPPVRREAPPPAHGCATAEAPSADNGDADAKLRAGGERSADAKLSAVDVDSPKQSVQSYQRPDGSLVQGYHRSAAKPPSASCRVPTVDIPVGGAVQVARSDSEHLGQRGRVVSAKSGYYQVQLPGPARAHFRGRDLLLLDEPYQPSAAKPPPADCRVPTGRSLAACAAPTVVSAAAAAEAVAAQSWFAAAEAAAAEAAATEAVAAAAAAETAAAAAEAASPVLSVPAALGPALEARRAEGAAKRLLRLRGRGLAAHEAHLRRRQGVRLPPRCRLRCGQPGLRLL